LAFPSKTKSPVIHGDRFKNTHHLLSIEIYCIAIVPLKGVSLSYCVKHAASSVADPDPVGSGSRSGYGRLGPDSEPDLDPGPKNDHISTFLYVYKPKILQESLLFNFLVHKNTF
jgi:hypothetical protein